MRRILPLLALTLFAGSAAHAQAQAAPPTLTRGVLKIAIEGTYAPFTYKDDKGNLTGYDVDFARLLAARLGLKPEFVLTEWSGILAGLQANKYDVIVNQVGITAERQKTIAFSEPYTYSRPQIAVHSVKGADYKALADLKGKRVGVGLGTTFEKDLIAAGGINIVTYPGTPEYLADLAAGRLDAIYNDKLLIGYLAKSQGLPIKGVGSAGSVDQMGVAMKKTNIALKVAIDRATRQMKADGTLAKLGEKWFGQDVSKP
ncbi:cystine ABC transporter substrate-binding protein [Deinococcus cavernae]|uniref:Cystine ABC transporter substrate-binding protein n=1 Tax=Deinococcus cavernae TaxID=2320857 RepID=A0A418V7G5_9DEIO|nr:transporter substrate-binding domain-containing protein [Deinococcus cavernae]RJF72031.1 cystine ABC transporter substrate-binding protein [Deinococcus cavernae]